jgi:chromosomal replication initiator protein
VEEQTENKSNSNETAIGLWDNLANLLRDKYGSQCSGTWFGNVSVLGYSDQDGLRLGVPSEWIRNWINNHYLEAMAEILSSITAGQSQISLTVDASLPKENPNPPAAPDNDDKNGAVPIGTKPALETTPTSPGETNPSAEKHHFLPQFTFDTFLEADCNRLAYNACRRLADRPDGSFNPLIIYGGAGLGKTHLLRAIENHLVIHRKDLRTVFVSSERFMIELVESLQRKTPSAFRSRFRSADILLIDDINKWNTAKMGTQDEFLNTFNDLHFEKKQIVISSNVHPQQSELSAPIKSRLDGGLVLEVSSPTVEICAAILSKKAEKEKILLPDEVIYLVANRYNSSIRLLEGALKKIMFYAETYDCRNITADMVNNALSDLPSPVDQRPSLEKIIQTISLHFDLRFTDIISASRKKSITYPRHLAMFLCRKHTTHSLPEIGERFGGRDHTTVLHAVRKIKTACETPGSTSARDITLIETSLKSSPLVTAN